eukprot:3330308-Prymnesium_polylepis.1
MVQRLARSGRARRTALVKVTTSMREQFLRQSGQRKLAALAACIVMHARHVACRHGMTAATSYVCRHTGHSLSSLATSSRIAAEKESARSHSLTVRRRPVSRAASRGSTPARSATLSTTSASHSGASRPPLS